MFVKQTIKIFALVLLLVGCSNNDIQLTTEETANEVIDLLVEGDYQKVHNEWFDEELQASISEDELEGAWGQQAAKGEAFQAVQSLEISTRGEDLEVVEATIEYTAASFELRMILNENQQLVGFRVSDAVTIMDPPESITEEKIIVGEGTDFPLEGILTLPKEEQADLPAVILVHGSGPSDKDEAVFSYRPFRDIAWGLAEQGIASIRYDKRTYTHGSEMAQIGIDLTVYEETVEDAILATELAKNDARIDGDNVFLIGHSLGGMLAPRIEVQGGDYAGLVILAGTPRSLWEVVYNQNLAMIDNLIQDEAEKEEQLELVEAEYRKAQELQEMSREEAKEMTVFGMNGFYLKEMDQYDVESIVAELEKPLLIMQGEDDFQVYYEKDFAMWQEILEKDELATLTSYPGLNHFFVDYEGPLKGTLAEYEVPNEVEHEVIRDIGEWILQQ